MRKDDVTQELPGVPARRGRPPTGNAKTGAARQAAYRQKMRESGLTDLSVMVTDEVAQALAKHVQFKDIPLGTAVNKILANYLLRKR